MNTLLLVLFTILFASCGTSPQKKPLEHKKPMNILKIRPQGDLPVLGKTESGQEVRLGGFSSLVFVGRVKKEEKEFLRFYTVTDRGPNADPIGKMRPFLLPDFHPQIIELLIDEATLTYHIGKIIELKQRSGEFFGGLPESSNDEVPVNIYGKKIKPKIKGIDTEGLAIDSVGNFWACEEGAPSVIGLDAYGKEFIRWLPNKGLPPIFEKRRFNRGLEGLALFGEKIFAFLQSPLEKESHTGLVLEMSLKDTKQQKIWDYLFDEGYDHKIGDAAFSPSGQLLVIEMNNQKREQKKFFSQRVYQVRMDESQGHLQKNLVLDLNDYNYPYSKAEGIAVLDDGRVAIVNDNDFDLSGPLDTKTGKAEFKAEIPEIWIFATSIK